MNPDFRTPRRALPFLRWSHELIGGHVHRTPLLECRSFSRMAGVRLRLKCENLQRGGSFKLRGALTKAMALSNRDRSRGLLTYSSGNHAQAVAIAARILDTRAWVVMPEDAVEVKVRATRSYGAEVLHAGRTSEERRVRAEELVREQGLAMIPPFDDPYVIAGQGTVGLEIMEEWPDARVVFVPVGGGGLIAGVSLAVQALGLGTRVVGVEPEGAASAWASLQQGRRVRLARADTIADGLRPLQLGELNWDIIRHNVAEVVKVTDTEIVEAVHLLLERAKLVVEPSGAATLAAAVRHAARFGGTAVAVLSGGNLDVGPLLRGLAPAHGTLDPLQSDP